MPAGAFLGTKNRTFNLFGPYLADMVEGDDGDGDDGRILGQGQARYSNAPRD